MSEQTVTDAERQAVAWLLRYRTEHGTASVSFTVLVPEHTSPEDFGGYRMMDMGLLEGSAYPHLEKMRVSGLTDADYQRVLDCETEIERDERRAAWQRQQDGPDEWPKGDAADAVHSAYRALMERRR